MKPYPSTTRSILYWLTIFSIILFSCIFIVQNSLAGGLEVSLTNPRYFQDSSGKAVYLVGSHTWNNGQDFNPVIFDFPGYLDFLAAYNHNFIRLWTWEEAKMLLDGFNSIIDPGIYERTGPGIAADGLPKFDLTKFNQNFFNRLRQRVLMARDRGIYVSVMLFNGWSIVSKSPSNPWTVHPFNRSNNINNVNGDPNNNGNGEETHTLQIPAIVALQEAYLRKVLDTLNDLDNVLYEVSNETDGTPAATQWEYHIINYVKNVEAGEPNQHLIGMTAQYPNGNNSDLFNSPADWISPNSSASYPYNYQTNPPPANGSKVIIADTDHLWGIGGDRGWAWKSFLRGLNVIYMDPYLGDCADVPADESLRKNLGYILAYADKMDLLNMSPQPNLSSTGYCLANIGHEYLVYSTSGRSFTVNLASIPGSFSVEWFNPSTGKSTSGGTATGGGSRSFSPPFSGDAILYLAGDSVVDTTPPTSPAGLTAEVVTLTQVTLSWIPSNDDNAVVGYKIFRNGAQVGSSTSTSYEDDNLTPNTTYRYTVSAYDSSGNSSLPSSPLSVTTAAGPADATPPIISNIKIYPGRNSAQITWTTNEPSDSQVEYGPTVGYGTKSSLNTNLSTNHRVILYGLYPGRYYHFRVYSKDASGNLSLSADQWFRTTWR